MRRLPHHARAPRPPRERRALPTETTAPPRYTGDAALALAETFLELSRAQTRDYLVPAALHNLGSVRLARGEFPAAERTLAAALELKRVARGADANVASCLNDLGIARKQLGKLKAAEACFEEALGLYAADGDRGDGAARAADVACARINLGNVYMSTGQITGAEACYGAALAAFREIHGAHARNADVAKALGNLGVVRDTRGD